MRNYFMTLLTLASTTGLAQTDSSKVNQLAQSVYYQMVIN